MNKKINILIVGGTGFIGFFLARKCLELGWSVTSISARKPRKLRKLSKVKYLISDISQKNFSKKISKREFDYVVNLGGYVDHNNKKKTYNTHYLGSANLANYFLKKWNKILFQKTDFLVDSPSKTKYFKLWIRNKKIKGIKIIEFVLIKIAKKNNNTTLRII